MRDAERLDLACWRINYSLHLTPHELYDYWQAHGTPTGAVLALKAAVEEIERLRAAVAAERDQPVRRVVDPRALVTHREIADAVRGIEKERRDAMRALMRDFDQSYYYPNLKDMRAACARIGHNWRFTHLGPLSDPWFSCCVCHASECRPERESA